MKKLTVCALVACASQEMQAPPGFYLRQPPPEDEVPPPVVQPGLDVWWPQRGTDLLPRAGEAVVLSTDAPSPTWNATGATVFGTGDRVTLAIPPDARRVTLSVCDGVDHSCRTVRVRPAPAAATVQIDTLTRIDSDARGSIWQMNGTVQGHDPSTPLQILPFVHTDIFYRRNPRAPVAADGSFSTTFYALGNVDRVAAVVVPRGQLLGEIDGCTHVHCFGTTDPATGERVPWLADGITNHAVDIEYIWPTSTLPDWEQNLLSRMGVPSLVGAPHTASLIKASLNRDRYYTYNQGTSAIALTALGHHDAARAILDAMATVQNADGSWYFSYREDGSSPFPGDGDYRIAGSVAWMAMAYSAYSHLTGDLQYLPTLVAVLDHLESQLVTWQGETAVRFNPVDLANTPWNESTHVSTEHNTDALAAFEGYRVLTGDTRYQQTEDHIRDFLLARWTGQYFTPGSHSVLGENTAEQYADTQTWTVLALGPGALPYLSGLDTNCELFFDPAGILTGNIVQVPGFSDLKVWGELLHGPVVWTEGTLGQVMAMQLSEQLGQPKTCEGLTPGDFVDRLEDTMGVIDGMGGLPEAMRTDNRAYNPDTTTTALVWYAYAITGINPFRPYDPPL